MATSTYNLNPTPQSGQGTFGLVPGAVQAPPSVWDELNQNVPNYGGMTSAATGDISSLLSGSLSPSTMRNIGDYAASRGVSLGQPNSPIANEIGMGLTGTTTEGLQQQGLTDYNSLTSTLAGTQQNPSLLADIASQNATNAAAPDPASANIYAQQLLQQAQQSARGPQQGYVGTVTAGYQAGLPGLSQSMNNWGGVGQGGGFGGGGGYGGYGSYYGY